MAEPRPGRLWLAVAAATVLNLPFGTIYAFSVFLKPMEALLGVTRAEMSMVFALATVTLTIGMNLAPRLYRALPVVPLTVASVVTSAAGLVITARADGLTDFALGYGVLFGLGGGVAFILMQQAVNQAAASVSGLVNGYLVSLYPLGAMIGAPVFGWAIAAHGLRATLAGLAAVVFVCGLIAVWMLRRVDVRLQGHASGPAQNAPSNRAAFWILFLVFFLAASAGLMVMSQAAGIVQAFGGRTALALGATTFITGAIAAARIGGGALVDRFAVPHVACGAHLWSLTGALILTLWPGPLVAVLGLAMIGMGYGFVSGLTAGAIPRYWHRDAFGAIASRMYIAWCVAAVCLPVAAGWLFDRTQGYGAAVLIAAGVNVVGALVAVRLPRGGQAG